VADSCETLREWRVWHRECYFELLPKLLFKNRHLFLDFIKSRTDIGSVLLEIIQVAIGRTAS
jgi:hypothetical protein